MHSRALSLDKPVSRRFFLQPLQGTNRNCFQKCTSPIPRQLSMWGNGNYIAHTTFLLNREENFHWCKLSLPVEVDFVVHRWGFCHGMLVMTIRHTEHTRFTRCWAATNYYFTMVLLNHNIETAPA
jgi:hypothetical protein